MSWESETGLLIKTDLINEHLKGLAISAVSGHKVRTFKTDLANVAVAFLKRTGGGS